MARTTTPYTIDASGLNDLVRDFKRLDKEFGKIFMAELRAVGEIARSRARSSPRTPRRTGKLASSIKVSVRRSQISLYSILPYAGVHEFGGTIQPRGTPIAIESSGFVRGAVMDVAPTVEIQMSKVIDLAARRYAEFH